MRLIIYGDFNCPYSYLASQRADHLARTAAAELDWRAVEHDRALPVTGASSESDSAVWERELAEVAARALQGEHAPAAPPRVISNTCAAVAAYAEAVADGIAGELRRRLFRAIWAEGRQISGAYQVRTLVTGLMWPAEDIRERLASPDIASLENRDPDLARAVRRCGGTVAPDGGPLTTAGWQRIREWRKAWLALPAQTIPAVIGPDRVPRQGVDGLRYLAGLAGHAGAADGPATKPAAEAGQGRQRRPAARVS